MKASYLFVSNYFSSNTLISFVTTTFYFSKKEELIKKPKILFQYFYTKASIIRRLNGSFSDFYENKKLSKNAKKNKVYTIH